jgi:uncharacterized protein
MHTETLIRTERGDALLTKLCRHFARKVPVTLAGRQGLIEFEFGRCRIDVDDDSLRLHVELNESGQIDPAECLLTSHLLDIARNKQLLVSWTRRDQ